jgi:hypothetical protein
MAFSPSDLYLEVLSVIAERSVGNEIISRGWLVTAVLHAHPIKRDRKADRDEFSLCCRQLAVSAAVDQALARLKHEDEGGTDPDRRELEFPRLPGFKHLRQIYPIRRDEGIFLVPLIKMTDDEIGRKIKTYRKASRGFAAHADELERYLATRVQAA